MKKGIGPISAALREYKSYGSIAEHLEKALEEAIERYVSPDNTYWKDQELFEGLQTLIHECSSAMDEKFRDLVLVEMDRLLVRIQKVRDYH